MRRGVHAWCTKSSQHPRRQTAAKSTSCSLLCRTCDPEGRPLSIPSGRGTGCSMLDQIGKSSMI